MRILLAISLLTALPLCAAEKPATKQDSQSQTVVTVGGQVRRPGPVPFHKNLTLYAAIQAAGGTTEFGSMRRVKVIHVKTITTHDLTKDKELSTLVQAGDTIDVPQKNLLGR